MSYYVANETNECLSSTQKEKPIIWTLDSGSSYHMICDKDHLENTRKYVINITFADGGFVKSILIGQYVGYMNGHKIILNDVLYIPTFKRNLMSIDHLNEEYFKVVFYKNRNNNLKCATLYDENGKRIYTSISNNTKTYKILTHQNHVTFNDNVVCFSLDKAIDDSNMNLWHRRLGHFNIDLIKEKLKRINIKRNCKICSCSKLKNFPHHLSENKSKETFELIHMDLASVPDYSMYGNKYFLTILYDYSRYGWVIFIKNKSDTYNAFIIWFRKIKNIFNKNIKYIRTDNGKEFINNNFEKFFEKHGIVHQDTVAYSPQQNGRVERLHGTLIANANAMLADAKLHHKFWQDAIATANYIHNRLPHKGNDNKVPFELLYNEKVDYGKFKVFGCQVYFYIPNNSEPKLKIVHT